MIHIRKGIKSTDTYFLLKLKIQNPHIPYGDQMPTEHGVRRKYGQYL